MFIPVLINFGRAGNKFNIIFPQWEKCHSYRLESSLKCYTVVCVIDCKNREIALRLESVNS
jgi:hypothetical protein